MKTISDVDRPGVRIAVGLGSAYELYLARVIKYATIVRAMAGGGGEMIMEIRQGMGAPKGRPGGARYLAAFVEEVNASGFVAAALERNNQSAVVAPLATR